MSVGHIPMQGRVVLATLLLIGFPLGLAACGNQPQSTAPSSPATPPQIGSPFPPRPAELPLDRMDPCALLTADGQAQLGVTQVGQGNDSDELGSAACQWANHGKPDNRWLVRLVTKRGAEYALASTTGVQVVQVGGFGAVQTAPPYVDPNLNCVLVVDVARGQSLNVKYSNIAGDYPGISHEVACELDRRAAELMVRNLRSLAH